MFVLALLLVGYLTITVSTQNSSVIDNALEWQTPHIDGQVIILPSGTLLFILSSYNFAPAPVPAPVVSQPDEWFPHRIVGGQKISIREAPWQAAIIEKGYDGLCGASVISRYWILTAAHCVSERGNYFVRAGSTYYKRGGQSRRIRKIIVHRNYNSYTMNNDIALVKVSSPFKFNKWVRPIKLAGSRWKLPTKYTVTGWGITNENAVNPSRVLRRVQVKAINRRTCARFYGRRARITKNMICAASPQKDSCSGDSGGPLVRRGRQYGVVSFGIGCARARSPGVYTDIRKYRKFISSVMRRY